MQVFGTFSQRFVTQTKSPFVTHSPVPTPTPHAISYLVINLIQWVVNASCLQIGCDFI